MPPARHGMTAKTPPTHDSPLRSVHIVEWTLELDDFGEDFDISPPPDGS